ncbi:MAG TPA: FAD:protein FMN transferase [Gemmatimonadales bacterium]|nr:FAD:protein FMN transferase [Gemmatimonadales bacterium]
MGTTLHVTALAADRGAGVAAIEAAFAAVARLDSLLSTWRDDSEIARLNAAPAGAPVPLSAELFTLLAEALRWCRATGGAFDPAVGPLVDAWDLRGRGRMPSAAELARARAAAGCDAVTLDAATRTGRRRSRLSWLDTGGFGKGAALRSALAALVGRGAEAGLLDFGGQVLVFGHPPAGDGWRIPVAHPAHRTAAALKLRLPGGLSAATSAQSERFVTLADTTLGHILDPRSGRPVAPWGSVTVVAADPAEADALSTALFVLGPEAGPRWAEHHAVAALFLVDRDGRLEVRSAGGADRFVVQDVKDTITIGG